MTDPIKCSGCNEACQLISIRGETVARCPECGTVLQNFDGEWMAKRDAIIDLRKRVSELEKKVDELWNLPRG